MRLIDADKLYPDRMTNRGTVAISQSQIANAPTVDVLDKIRAEIKQLSPNYPYTDDLLDEYVTMKSVFKIIDRYREGESK